MKLKNEFSNSLEDWQNKLESDLEKTKFTEITQLIKDHPSGFKLLPFYHCFQENFYRENILPWDSSSIRNPGGNDFEIITSMSESNYINDIFSSLIHTRKAFDEFDDLVFNRNHLIRGDFIHEAGGDEVDEINFLLSCLIEYLKVNYEKESAISLSFAFSYSQSFFMNIAKTRALKFIIAKLTSIYKIKVDYRIIGIPSFRDEGLFDIENNIIRRTVSYTHLTLPTKA